jgi:outer membrane receptor protein involved in Fe transport
MVKKGIMPRLITFAVFLFLYSNIFGGETGKIAGRITDAKTGEPLPSANVLITASWENGVEVPLQQTIGTASDFDGYYYILNVRPGTFSLTVSYIGYGKSMKTQVLVYVDKTTTVDFALEPKEFQSQEVVITAFRAPKIEIDRTSTKQVFNINDIESIAGVNNVEDIIALQADVVDDHFRGGREGESLYLLGGASINNPISASKAFSPIVTGIQQVEVFTSGFSAEYGNAQSGVVNMVPKEGGDIWQTRLAYSLELPHYNTWGGNPFSTEYMPMWDKLSNAYEWLKNQDPQLSTSDAMFKDFFNFWPDGYAASREDSLRLATLAMKDWIMMARDIGLEYLTPITSRIDISTGGPVSDNIKIFVAARQDDETPIVPTPVQDRTRQWLSNLTTNIDKNNKLTLSFSFNDRYRNNVDDNPDTWFDRIFAVPKETQNSKLYGIDYNGVLSNSSFYNISIKVLNTYEDENPEYLDPDKYRNDAANGERIGGMQISYVGRFRNTPFGTANNMELNRGYEKSTTYSLIGSFTSQLDKGNMIKAGVQLYSYYLNAYRESNLKSFTEKSVLSFTAYPFEGGIFLQDKMEFEGMVANFGLRYDFYNFNTDYFVDQFRPRVGGESEHTKIVGHLSPRLGVSFPISENSVFHLNYGAFVQRPSFNRIYYTTWISETEFSKIGNPTLKPERTNAYDVGIVQGLPFGITLDVSAYYKDVKDLVHEAAFFSNTGDFYVGYGNLDYANIRGFHVNLEKMDSKFKTYFNYNYQISTGKASDPGDQNIVEVYEDLKRQTERSPKDILMDYDRTHRFVANISYSTDKDEGPQIFGTHLFGHMNFSATLRFQSGQPYTDDDQFLGLIYNKRMPDEFDLRIRVQKAFKIADVTYMIYLEGFNVLNQKVYNAAVFDDNSELNLLKRYKNGERESLVWYDWKASGGREDYYANRYKVSMEQTIYRNIPRYFRIGLEMRL